MQLLASLVFTLFLFVWTFLYAMLFVVMALCVPFPRRASLARVWAVVLLTALKWLCRLDYTVEGWEHIPKDNHIALWKHASTWETLAIGVVFPRQVWVLKRELLWIPFVGWSIRLLHAIAIDRGAGHNAVNQVVEQGRQRLQEGGLGRDVPRGHPHAGRPDPPLRRQRCTAGLPDRQADHPRGRTTPDFSGRVAVC
ncbi:MAG: 1-acyl-sn-glycerol-3-phosphate acyltransferase [Steroidobacteraceae bacterium]